MRPVKPAGGHTGAAAVCGGGSGRRQCTRFRAPLPAAARALRHGGEGKAGPASAPGAVIAWWIRAAVAVAGGLLVDGARGSRGSLWRLESRELECRVSRAVGI